MTGETAKARKTAAMMNAAPVMIPAVFSRPWRIAPSVVPVSSRPSTRRLMKNTS